NRFPLYKIPASISARARPQDELFSPRMRLTTPRPTARSDLAILPVLGDLFFRSLLVIEPCWVESRARCRALEAGTLAAPSQSSDRSVVCRLPREPSPDGQSRPSGR